VIVQRGTFAELVEVKGYIRDISRDQSSSDEQGATCEQATNTDSDATSKTEQGHDQQATTVSPSTSDEQADDEKPPATENSIYRYYLSSIKKVDVATFLFFQTLVSFLACFSCTLSNASQCCMRPDRHGRLSLQTHEARVRGSTH